MKAGKRRRLAQKIATDLFTNDHGEHGARLQIRVAGVHGEEVLGSRSEASVVAMIERILAAAGES